MNPDSCDEEIMIEFSIGALLESGKEPRSIVGALVRTFPAAPALSILYVLSMAASAVEQMLSASDTRRKAQDMWRMVGLIGVDLYTMKCMNIPCETAADLIGYWQSCDPFFLD